MPERDKILEKLYSIHRKSTSQASQTRIEQFVCPNCGSTNLVRSVSGSLVCANCGTVVEDRPIDLGPEWRAFSGEEAFERSRVGPAIKGSAIIPGLLTTDIDVSVGDSVARKLERLQKRVAISTPKERAKLTALSEAERIATVLGLPRSIIDEAMRIFDKAYDEGIHVGRTIKLVVAACLYLACRIHGIARTIDEFVRASGEAWTAIAEVARLIVRRLNIKLPLSDPKVFVDKICQQLRVSGQVVKLAKKILDEARKKRLTAGKDPAGLAAAAVYIACLLSGEIRTQKEVAIAAGVTEVTVRNRYKEIASKLGIKIPVSWSKE